MTSQTGVYEVDPADVRASQFPLTWSRPRPDPLTSDYTVQGWVSIQHRCADGETIDLTCRRTEIDAVTFLEPECRGVRLSQIVDLQPMLYLLEAMQMTSVISKRWRFDPAMLCRWRVSVTRQDLEMEALSGSLLFIQTLAAEHLDKVIADTVGVDFKEFAELVAQHFEAYGPEASTMDSDEVTKVIEKRANQTLEERHAELEYYAGSMGLDFNPDD